MTLRMILNKLGIEKEKVRTHNDIEFFLIQDIDEEIKSRLEAEGCTISNWGDQYCVVRDDVND